MNKAYLMWLFLLIGVISCNVEKESDNDHQMGATINGEEWYFYDASITPSDSGTVLMANGYLAGDRGAEQANLQITFVGINNPAELTKGYTADFTPTSTGTSAIGILRFPDQNRVFDTKLDPEARGTFKVTSVENNTLNGTFDFTVKDQQGNALKLEGAEFNDIAISQ